MVRTASIAWSWYHVINAKGSRQGQQHPDVRCRFCPKTINNAMLGRGLLKHTIRCSGAPSSVIIQAQRLQEAAQSSGRSRLLLTPVRNVARSLDSSFRRLSFTPPATRRSSMIGVVPSSRLDTTDAVAVRNQIARAIFAANLPFRTVDNKEVRALLEALCPPGSVPSRQSLATTLLDDVYEALKEQVVVQLKAQERIIVVTDGWSNQSNRGFVNFVLVAPSMRPVFWKSVETSENQNTGDYLSSLARDLINELEGIVGRGKIIGVVSDNASNMLSSWRILQQHTDHTTLLSHGCAAHALNSLIQSIFENVPSLGNFLNECTEVAKFVKKRQALLSCVGDAQFDQETRRALALPVSTRWYTQETTIKSVMGNQVPLQRAFSNASLMSRYQTSKSLPAVDRSVFDCDFWYAGELVLSLLDPVTTALAKIEEDNTSISMVNEVFLGLAQNPMYTTRQSNVDAGIQEDILAEVNARWAKVRNDEVDVAYLLDPSLKLGAFAHEKLIDFIERAVKLAQRVEAHDNASSLELREALKRFVEDKLRFTDSQRQLFAQYGPVTWWNFQPQYGELARFAKKLLSIPASSAASERSWSVFSFIHTKARNQLIPARVDKLAFIYSNACENRQVHMFADDLEAAFGEDGQA